MKVKDVPCVEILSKDRFLAKFKVGRSCIIDKGTPSEQAGVIVKSPFKNRFKEWFVVVAVVSEAMHPRTYEYFQKRFDVRILKERVSLS